MLRVTQIASIDEGIIVDVDVNIDHKTVLLVSRNENVSLVIDGWDRHVWRLSEMPHLYRSRWIFENEVACWTTQTTGDHTNAVLVCSKVGDYYLPIGTPRHVVGGKNVSYVSYGEEQYLSAEEGDIEENMVIAFDRYRRITFGIKEFLRNSSWRSDPMEVSAACITGDDKLIISFYGCPGIWCVDAIKRDLTCIPGSSEIDQVFAIAEHEGVLLISSIGEQQIRFCRLNIRSGSLVCDSDIEITKLFPKATSKSLQFNKVSVHGCPGGVIVVKSIDSAFSVAFEK